MSETNLTDEDQALEARKARVQNLRFSVLGGILAGIALQAIGNLHTSSLNESYKSALFGDTATWPSWLIFFGRQRCSLLPLPSACACFSC